MESVTEKQVITLKKFAKNPELSREILRGVEFGNLTKQEASELISKCINRNPKEEPGEFRMKYSQNFKDGSGKFKTATLTDDEVDRVREAHREHCKQVLEECEEDFDQPEVILSVFEKRCDKIFTWIQQALDEKVRKKRNGFSNGFKPGTEI